MQCDKKSECCFYTRIVRWCLFVLFRVRVHFSEKRKNNISRVVPEEFFIQWKRKTCEISIAELRACFFCVDIHFLRLFVSAYKKGTWFSRNSECFLVCVFVWNPFRKGRNVKSIWRYSVFCAFQSVLMVGWRYLCILYSTWLCQKYRLFLNINLGFHVKPQGT